MVFRKIFGPSHSRNVPPLSRAPASELVLQGMPAFRDRITGGGGGERPVQNYVLRPGVRCTSEL